MPKLTQNVVPTNSGNLHSFPLIGLITKYMNLTELQKSRNTPERKLNSIVILEEQT
jgi:hypothetical protein